MKSSIFKVGRLIAVSLIFVGGITFSSCGGGAEQKPAMETSSNTSAKETTKTVKFAVSGMTCGACVESINSAVAKQEGVKECTVSLEEKSATITYETGKTDEDKLMASIEQAGYKAEVN